MYIWSIVIIVVSNILYNVSLKLTPENASPFPALLATYAAAAIAVVIASIFDRSGKGLVSGMKDLNWTSLVLGLSIAGLEFGYLMAFRSGWNISTGSLVANILLAITIIPIGIIFFREDFSLMKAAGAALCIFGLVLINW